VDSATVATIGRDYAGPQYARGISAAQCSPSRERGSVSYLLTLNRSGTTMRGNPPRLARPPHMFTVITIAAALVLAAVVGFAIFVLGVIVVLAFGLALVDDETDRH
jgi:hypothetical protein